MKRAPRILLLVIPLRREKKKTASSSPMRSRKKQVFSYYAKGGKVSEKKKKRGRGESLLSCRAKGEGFLSSIPPSRGKKSADTRVIGMTRRNRTLHPLRGKGKKRYSTSSAMWGKEKEGGGSDSLPLKKDPRLFSSEREVDA